MYQIIKIPILLILFTQKLRFYNKGWYASLSLSTKTISFSINCFSSLTLKDWTMFEQVE